jgi:hypothetical protein
MLLTVVVLQLREGIATTNGSYVERRGRSLVEFYSGQRNQRRVLGCEFVDVWGRR